MKIDDFLAKGGPLYFPICKWNIFVAGFAAVADFSGMTLTLKMGKNSSLRCSFEGFSAAFDSSTETF